MKSHRLKEIVSKILNVGKSKVLIDNSDLGAIKKIVTKDDVRKLIEEKVIKVKKENYQSRYNARKLKEQKRKGRRKGTGSKKGTKKARIKKNKWVEKVRKERKYLRDLKKELKFTDNLYRRAYKLIKGNHFKGKKQLKIFIEKENKV